MDHEGVLRTLSNIFGVKFVEAKTIKYLRTGIAELDDGLEVLWTEGSIIELYGGPGSGKTAILDRIAESANKAFNLDSRVAFFDCDHSKWVKDPNTRDSTVYCRPGSLNELKDIACALMNDGGVSVVLIDAINALPSENEETYWNHAANLRKVVSDIATAAAQNKAFVAITSQVRTMKGLTGTTVSASKGVLPYAVTQIFLERLKTIKRVKEAGCRVRATILSKVKKKANASTSCEFDLVFPGGIQ